MFETDEEYLKRKEEIYKKRGLKIIDINLLLKERYKFLKTIFIISISASIMYSFIIGFAFGGR